MEIGDTVIVLFADSNEPIVGTLLEHTADWKNVTVKTSRGGEMNGSVEDIEDASLFT